MGGPQQLFSLPCEICKEQGRWRVFKFGETRVGRVCPACAYKWLVLIRGGKPKVRLKTVTEKIKIGIPTICCPRCKQELGTQRKGLGPFKISCGGCGFKGAMVFVEQTIKPAEFQSFPEEEPQAFPEESNQLPQGRSWNQ